MGTAPNGYQTPKTDWTPEPFDDNDFNRIEGNINAIETGSRTIDPAQAPSGISGTLRQLLDWFANRIKAITGGTNWWDAPAATIASLLSSLNSHIGLTTTAHGGITPSTHIGSGGSSHAAVTTSTAGFMSAADKTKLNGIEAGATADQTASEILTALKTVDGPGSGLDADTIDGKQATDFMNNTKTYGNVTYTDSIAANSTLTKTIALGGTYKHANVMISSGDDGYGILIITETNNLKAMVIGAGRYNNLDMCKIWTREAIGAITTTSSLWGYGFYTTGNVKILISECYINGSNLIIIFKNEDTTAAHNLNCKIYWGVW